MAPLELDRVLTFKPGLTAWSWNDHAVFLIGELERFVCPARPTALLTPLIDGRRSVREILDVACPDRLSEPEALYELSRLVAAGHLVTASPGLPHAIAAFWHGQGLDAATSVEALGRTAVSVRALVDSRAAGIMVEALEHAGVRVEAHAPLQVVVTDDYSRPELHELNRTALATGTPWCVVRPSGLMPLIGPLFRPGFGPCWACLSFRLRGNRAVEELLNRRGAHCHTPHNDHGSLEESLRTACGLAALALARSLAAGVHSESALQEQVLALDLRSLQTTTHVVVRRPQCADCGDPGLMRIVGERRVALRALERPYRSDGGYRVRSARQTYERYRNLVSPITGAVTHLGPMPGRDTELRAVYASGYMLCPAEGTPLGNVFDRACAGKGRSAEQARASALAEALERSSGVYQGDEAKLRACAEELGSSAVAPASLLSFSDAQYRSRDERGRYQEPARWVPERCSATTVIDWTPAWSLTRNERRYVPLSYCYAEAPSESGTRFVRACSNGAAAGNCLEEAILQGLFELCERDAVAIWWYNRIRRPALDLGGFRDEYFDSLLAEYAHLGWQVWALDLTHDLGIPTYVALGHHPGEDRFCIGFGCHLESKLAIQRALTELNQLFDPAGAQRAPWDVARLSSRDFLFPDPELPATGPKDSNRQAGTDNLEADIESCVQRLRDLDLELIVVDKTRPDIGLSVAQVIVPGLRHFWPRFGPGRLYQVPCTLGWLSAPLTEAELNPVALLV